MVKFLSMNGLLLRCLNENNNFASAISGAGLYLNTFVDLLFSAEPSLEHIAEKLPTSAKYISPEIQNEVILKHKYRRYKIHTIVSDVSTNIDVKEYVLDLKHANNCR